MKERGERLLNAPPPPLPVRVQKWARARRPRPLAKTIRCPGDDKNKCQRLLLAPYAALVVRSDGVLLRVGEVRRPPANSDDGCCIVELLEGVDEWMLKKQPLPPEVLLERTTKLRTDPQAGARKVSAATILPPEYPMIIPGFFGGVLTLANGLNVRVVDADVGEPGRGIVSGSRSASPRGDQTGGGGGRRSRSRSPRGERARLSNVKIAMLDHHGEPVGRAVWCDVQELMENLTDRTMVVPMIESEEGLRRETRLELHRAEQRRVAMASLKAEAMEPKMQIPDDSMEVLGLEGLLHQLDLAAPTPLIEAGQPNADGELAPGYSPKGIRPKASRSGSAPRLRV